MTAMQYVAAFALPFIGALQRFAVAYGYQGRSRGEARRSARGVFLILAAFSAVVVALRS